MFCFFLGIIFIARATLVETSQTFTLPFVSCKNDREIKFLELFMLNEISKRKGIITKRWLSIRANFKCLLDVNDLRSDKWD